MLGDVVISPIDAAQQLSAAAVDGRLEALAEAHDLSLVVRFGSASRGQPDARDLDVAVGSRTRTGLDVVAVICALMDLVTATASTCSILIGPVQWLASMRWYPAYRCTSTDRVSSLASRCGPAGSG